MGTGPHAVVTIVCRKIVNLCSLYVEAEVDGEPR